MIPNTISFRLLVASSVVLAGFLGLTGFALYQAFERSARASAVEQLQTQIYMLLSAADTDALDMLALPPELPDPRLSVPGSGIFAQVSQDGRAIWRSASSVGLEIPLPGRLDPGQPTVTRVELSGGERLTVLDFAVLWELEGNRSQNYTFQVAREEQGMLTEIAAFRRTLLFWLGTLAVVLLAVQWWVMRWGIAPLRKVARELVEVEKSERETLSRDYPRELARVTESLNNYIAQSKRHLERYRNALGDLAHSLKTPLAVMRGTAESCSQDNALRTTVTEQVGLMAQTVDYQLRRAAAQGRSPLMRPLQVEPCLQRIARSLAKVHAERNLHLTVDVDPDAVFFGDEGDFSEIVANLGDNACKWARAQVCLRARTDASLQGPHGALILEIEDDGPGLPQSEIERALQRGTRLDHQTEGHGIGLAIVRDLVEGVYDGELSFGCSALGGAAIGVKLASA